MLSDGFVVQNDDAHVLINTLEKKFKEHNFACFARSLSVVIERPTNKDFVHYVENNMLSTDNL